MYLPRYVINKLSLTLYYIGKEAENQYSSLNRDVFLAQSVHYPYCTDILFTIYAFYTTLLFNHHLFAQYSNLYFGIFSFNNTNKKWCSTIFNCSTCCMCWKRNSYNWCICIDYLRDYCNRKYEYTFGIYFNFCFIFYICT